MKPGDMRVHEREDGSFLITDHLGNPRAHVQDGKMAAIHLGMALAELDIVTAERDRLAAVLKEIVDNLYGQGLRVLGWHLNGDEEPLDTWFEENGWCEAAEAAKAKDVK